MRSKANPLKTLKDIQREVKTLMVHNQTTVLKMVALAYAVGKHEGAVTVSKLMDKKK